MRQKAPTPLGASREHGCIFRAIPVTVKLTNGQSVTVPSGGWEGVREEEAKPGDLFFRGKKWMLLGCGTSYAATPRCFAALQRRLEGIFFTVRKENT